MKISWNNFEANTAVRLGEALHYERVRTELSLHEVAKKARMVCSEIDKIELGKSPLNLEDIFKLVKVYDCKMVLAVSEDEEVSL